jgi:hypothetical protein
MQQLDRPALWSFYLVVMRLVMGQCLIIIRF